MSFQELYKLITKNKRLRNHYFKKAEKYMRKIPFQDFRFLPALSIELNRVCYNKCRFCCRPHTGEEYDYSELKKDFHKFDDMLYVTGCEPLLSVNLKNLINDFIEVQSKKDKYYIKIQITTSGVNPDVKEEIQEKYYDNLEYLFSVHNLKKGEYKEKNGTYVYVHFTFSDGVKPRERLENFLRRYDNLMNKYQKSLGMMIDSITEGDKTEKIRELIELYEEVFNTKVEYELNEPAPVLGNGRTGELYKDSKCTSIDNTIDVKIDGTVSVCCSVIQLIKNLEPVGNIDEPFEDLFEKKKLYVGLIAEFQEEHGDSCTTCVNEFPKFLEKVLKKHK